MSNSPPNREALASFGLLGVNMTTYHLRLRDADPGFVSRVNDVWGNPGQSTATGVLNAYTTVLANLRSVNPNAILFVAQIIPVNPSNNSCSSANPCNYEATLDAGIPAWVTAHTTAASPVYSVNLENLYNNGYFPNSTYTTDGVHPLLAGAQPMGTTMSAAMIAQVPGL